jgi:hypothetical protein
VVSRRRLVAVDQVDVLVAVGRDVVRKRAADEDPGDDDQRADREAVPEEPAPRVCPLAAGLDLEAVLVDLFDAARLCNTGAAGDRSSYGSWA